MGNPWKIHQISEISINHLPSISIRPWKCGHQKRSQPLLGNLHRYGGLADENPAWCIWKWGTPCTHVHTTTMCFGTGKLVVKTSGFPY